MPDLDPEVIKALRKKGSADWNQKEIDSVVVYLFSRGFTPPETYPPNVRIRKVRWDRYTPLPKGEIDILDARFRDPGTGHFVGAEKALGRAYANENRNSKLKEMVRAARRALLTSNEECQIKLDELYQFVGGNPHED